MFSIIFNVLFPDIHSAIRFSLFLLGGIAIGWALRTLLLSPAMRLQRASKNNSHSLKKILSGTLLEAVARTSPFLCIGAAIVAYGKYEINAENLSPEAAGTLSRLFWCFATCALGIFLWNLVRMPLALIRRYSSPGNKSTATLLPLLSALIKICIVAFGILILIRIATDTQPTEVLAMLGIGGLAVGLASQDTVKNFFGSVMLILDRPFQVGDAIDIGDGHGGTVEEVGVRSTRIRSRDGSVLSVPNGDLANRTIRTVTARETIRDEIILGLSCSTSPEQIETAIELLKKKLDDPRCIRSGGNAPRVFFGNFRDSSLEVSAVYHFASSNYAEFLGFKNELNLEILREFNRAGLEFAFPSRTVYLRQSDKPDRRC